jgi:hypothetical protein
MRPVLLTKAFRADQFERALESWDWIGIGGRKPVFCSLFGDVFLEAPDGFWFLDTIEGTLIRRWPDRDTLRRELDTDEGQDQYLLGGLAMAAERGGLVLGVDEVYDFVQPPILGGQFAVENIAKMDFVVSIHLTGQLLGQVRQLPPGSKITGFTIDGS